MALLKQTWFVALIGLLAVCMLLWLLGPYAGWAPLEGVFGRLVATLALTLVWGGAVMFLFLRRRKANANLLAGIAGGESEGSGAQEAERLTKQFEEAIKTLRESRGKRGAVSLYDLPWYVIIGPPGAGKTTVLSNSGLRFPLATKFGNKALRGIGGTRNCDWWFTDEAIFLDTAGRYTTQDSQESVDREGWRSFLELLKRYRRRRPINGVIIAISLQDVLTLDPTQRQQHVMAIRRRVAELERFFGIRFPVYALLTKCDLVPGFTEYFDDLGAVERAQVWGFTLGVEDSRSLANLESHLENEFGALISRLQGRLLRRIHEERDLTRRGALFSFPDQIAAVLEIVRGFLFDAFAPSAYEEATFLRGVYLTSGTQEGAPIDRLLGGLARSFGLEEALAATGSGQGRSYFITRLLRDVMFQESGLTGVNRRFEHQRVWLQRASYLGALALTLLAAAAWTASYTLNKHYIAGIGKAVSKYNEIVGADPGTPGLLDAGARLDAARVVLTAAAKYESGVPFAMRFGLYQGEYLATTAQTAYRREVDHQLMPRLRVALEREIANPAHDVYQVYELLRVYLMLGDPSHFVAEDVLAAANALARSEPAAATNDPAKLIEHLADGFDREPRPQSISPEVVAGARQKLAAQPLEVFVLNRIKRDFERAGEAPLSLGTLLGPRAAGLVSAKSGQPLETPISALYTRKGFYEFFLKQSAKRAGTLADEQWVLGDSGDALQRMDIATLPAKLAQLYQAEYVKTWDALLADVRLARLGGLQDAADKLLVLSGMDSPIRLFLTALERNTALAEMPATPGIPAADAAGKAIDAVTKAADRFGDVLAATGVAPARGDSPGKPIETHFKPLRDFVRGVEGGPGRLDALLASLGQIQQEIATTGSGLGKESASATVVRGDVSRRLELEAQQLPPPVREWILQLAGDVRRAVVSGAAIEVKQQISAEVAASCSQLLAGRYPFVRDSPTDVKLGDFGRVFAQGGLIDGFFQARLAPLVDTMHRPWRWKSSDGGGLGLSPAALAQFERAAAIREMFFGMGGPLPNFTFEVKPLRLTQDFSQVLLSIDGQSLTYRHGPIMGTRIEWPGKTTGAVRIVLTRPDGTQQSRVVEGPWALFRFLDEVGQPGAEPDRLLAAFGAGQSGAQFEFIAGSALNPLHTNLLTNFKCPGGT